MRLNEGVYLAGLGPSLKRPQRYARSKVLGADVVGMSTVPEVICARHCGLRVAAIAVVVNLASGLTSSHITHDETLHFADLASDNMKKVVSDFVAESDKW